MDYNRYHIATCLLCLLLHSCFIKAGDHNNKMAFWESQPQHGANCYNIHVDEGWFKAAKAAGFNWVRLTWDKWPGSGRDFLAGDLDNYQSLQPDDLKRLYQVLDLADRYQLPVVLVPLGLPGCRWVQNNGGIRDNQLWSDAKLQNQAVQFWSDIARALNDHPAVVGYSLLSAPPVVSNSVWPELNSKLHSEIRKTDTNTPIIIESADFGNPAAGKNHLPIPGNKTLYAIHFMEPWDYSSRFNFIEKRGLRYPGAIKQADKTEYWDRKRLEQELAVFTHWAQIHKIPSHRLLVSAFGCFRRNPDADIYLHDVISVLNQNKLHWAFYAFREDAWDGYDLECGSEGFGEAWWKAHDEGKPMPRPRKQNPLWQVILDALKD